MKLLQALRQKYPQLSQKQARQLIKDRLVGYLGRRAHLSDNVDDPTSLTIPDENAATQLSPNPKLSLKILAETADFLFLDKPAGLHSVAHDFAETQSVANAILNTHPELAALDPLECGLAHRLDFATSGVIVAAKNKTALEFLRQAFAKNQIQKIYTAIVAGQPQPGLYEAYALPTRRAALKTPLALTRPLTQENPKKLVTRIISAQIDKTINAKMPISDAPVTLSRVAIELVTGHRHQIRAHLALLGFPLWGDTLYGSAGPEPFFLHAEKLSFTFAGQNLTVTSPCRF